MLLRWILFLLLCAAGLRTGAAEAETGGFAGRFPDQAAALQAAIDWTLPELRDMSGGSDLEPLAEYFSRRPLPGFIESVVPEADSLEVAEAVLRDTFFLQGVEGRQPRRADGGLDWLDRGPRNDPEWAWMLNRQNYLLDLMAATERTGDQRYPQAIRAHVRDWILANPYPGRMTFSAPWRALEAARRILNPWLRVFFHRAPDGSPTLDAETRLLMLASLLDHAHALENHASFWGGNHLVTETSALAVIAASFPEFRESARWMDFARERTERELSAQTYPDGSFKELTNHYQLIATREFQRFLDVAGEDTGNPGLARMRERVQAMWDYLARVSRPDGTGPLNSASDLEHNRDASAAHAGPLPESPASVWFPWAGHCVMRNDWSPGSDWAFFDLGPHGSGHQHEDALHLSLCLAGRDFLVDSGRYTYRPGVWSEYFRGPTSHNVLLLNGAASEPPPHTVETPLRNEVVLGADYDLARGKVRFAAEPAQGRGGAEHSRCVIFLKMERLWLVIDRVDGFGARDATAIWNFAPGLEKDAILARMDYRVSAGFSATESWFEGQEKPFIAGFRSERFNEKVASPQLRVALRGRGPLAVAWLFAEPASDGRRPRILGLDTRGREIQILLATADGQSLSLSLAESEPLRLDIERPHE